MSSTEEQKNENISSKSKEMNKEILIELLKNTLENSLIRLENRGKEQIISLENCSSAYSSFDNIIKDLVEKTEENLKKKNDEENSLKEKKDNEDNKKIEKKI